TSPRSKRDPCSGRTSPRQRKHPLSSPRGELQSELYRFIHAEKANYPIALLCRVLHVARSSYYAWCEGDAARCRCRAADDALAHEITVPHLASRRTYLRFSEGVKEVLTKALDGAVGDEAGGESEEGFVDVGTSFPADA
ncbi:hypothetical protein ACFVXF_38305, partial [Streptomyces sp. NPDC058219]